MSALQALIAWAEARSESAGDDEIIAAAKALLDGAYVESMIIDATGYEWGVAHDDDTNALRQRAAQWDKDAPHDAPHQVVKRTIIDEVQS